MNINLIRQPNADRPAGQRLAVAGGLLGALAATACCIAPLVLFTLGVGGAWMSNLTALAPYQPYILALTVACLGYGYWLVYRSRRRACAASELCARPFPNRLMFVGLGIATVLVVAAVGFDFFAPILLAY
jgi:mercuric ion transport protein